jgi:hypothetical protein
MHRVLFPDAEPFTRPEPRVTIEMGGPNLVVRSAHDIDRTDTVALVAALNAAAATDTVVVLDPVPMRCGEDFAGFEHAAPELADLASRVLPLDAQVVAPGVIRIDAEHTVWLIDLISGRFCQTDTAIDVHFLPSGAWTPIVAVCVTNGRMTALTADGGQVSAIRSHRH